MQTSAATSPDPVNTTPSTETPSVIYAFPVDVEHAGIRVAIPLIIILSGIALYAWLSDAWPTMLITLGVTDDAIGGITAIILAFVGALLIGAAADRLLKRFWPSGRTLQLDSGTLTLISRRDKSVITLHRDKRLNVRSWRFLVRRNSPRAPRGWYMVASQLMQDEADITIYTFLPPRKFEALPLAHTCLELQAPPDRLVSLENRSAPLRGRAEERLLGDLENGRLLSGAELRPDDFATLVTALAADVPGWSD